MRGNVRTILREATICTNFCKTILMVKPPHQYPPRSPEMDRSAKRHVVEFFRLTSQNEVSKRVSFMCRAAIMLPQRRQ
ncbi:hypothetical protein RMSM_07514 [Rhodopirellula maiorica SM1]|uniref:Uncharacterized protein n=1 Tax=Rhodopirellula maiorica SM1 TaxID=1265738 RepID=M5RNL0_9BACT|nr:hypothetical protein RMSM_07514 [Rhodopirellula maiorica SM1]